MSGDARSRLYFLDGLRIAAFGLLVIYHVGMIYVPWGFHVMHDPVYPALGALLRLSNPWRMSLLFVISGVATAWMLHRGGLARDRSYRLLVPLLAGIFVIVPLQPYIEVREYYGYKGSFLEFMGLYLSGYGGFCKDGDCQRLPTWAHLWYLPYLWTYTMAALAIWRWVPRPWLRSLADRLARLRGLQLIFYPLLVIFLIRITLIVRYPENHAFTDDFWAHAHYGLMFAIGLLMGRRPVLMERLVPLRWAALVLALAAWATMSIYLSVYSFVLAVPAPYQQILRAVYALQQVGAIVAAFGFAQRWWTRDFRWRAELSDAVFPMYLIHQTVIVVGFVALRPLDLHPLAEASWLVLMAGASGIGLWALARRWQPLRPWVGMKRTDGPGERKAAQAERTHCNA